MTVTDRRAADTISSSSPPLVFMAEAQDGRTELLVNFGLFASRDATPAEIDQLARRLLPLIGQLTIVSEQHYEFSAGAEGTVHQVRITLPTEDSSDGDGRDELIEALLEQTRQWARSCFADRHPSISDDLQDLL